MNKVKIGTKSVLYGAHCFLIHWIFVAWGWWKLYGFPYDPRLWIAFIVHDLGYIGKPNMDGPEGELHPYLGAKIMGFLFGRKWYDFVLYHSRFLSKRENATYSKLCVADKMSFQLTPSWIYLPMVRATGEIHEYMYRTKSKYASEVNAPESELQWYNDVKSYMRDWIKEHKEIKEDTWTKI